LNNLRAGRNQKRVRQVLEFLRSYPEVHHVETHRAGALPDAIADLARRRVDLLVVNGGDGTLQHALTEILTSNPFERVPLIAPLRGGRTNMTALDLGAHRNPVKGLAAVLEAARKGTVAERLVRRPVLRIESATRREVQYGMFFGAGMIHRAIALTHRIFPPGRSQGVFGAGAVTGALLIKTAFRAKDGVLTPDKAQILLDGEMVRHGEFRLLIASSLQRLFLKMNPFWGQEPGGVHFTAMAHGANRVGWAIPGMLRGRPRAFVTPEAGYTSKNSHQVDLHFDCGFTVDGEIFPALSGELVTLTADQRVTFVRA
jgi:diacylglycerol kinase family enzyme